MQGYQKPQNDTAPDRITTTTGAVDILSMELYYRICDNMEKVARLRTGIFSAASVHHGGVEGDRVELRHISARPEPRMLTKP